MTTASLRVSERQAICPQAVRVHPGRLRHHRDPPGEEAQVDYGDGPMVRDPNTGKYRRTSCLF